ncbi:MAG: hypothetical protein RLZ47_1670 [Bacteroidota bacterium]|jgi:cytochrome c oxidase assembly protein subunit 15
MYTKAEKRFIRINLISIISLFVLILAGGVVRGTGSGMGCPDWPKCFDQYIPPTSASELPADYQNKYVAGRVIKNQKFANKLDVLGYADLADRIRNDRSILEPEEFNAGKTWTEYINRLIGALTGLFLLACVVLSFPYLKSRKRIFFLSLLNVVLVGFQAWMGSIVVSTNLLAWVVTVHMLLAFLIVAITIYTYFDAKHLHLQSPFTAPLLVRIIAGFVLALTLFQVTLGTEVREQIDAIATAMNQMNRADWVSKLGLEFNFHRDLAVLVLGANFLLFRFVFRIYGNGTEAFRMMIATLNLITLQLITGLCLSYLALPPVAQVAHLLLATLLFSAQFYLFLSLSRGHMLRKEASVE